MTWITSNEPPQPDDQPDAASDDSQPDAGQPRMAHQPSPPTPPTGSIPAVTLDEPPRDPLEDTNPSLAVMPAVRVEAPAGDAGEIPMWRRAVGLALLLAAASLTFVAGLIIFVPLLTNMTTPDQVAQQETPASIVTDTPAGPAPTTSSASVSGQDGGVLTALAPLSPEQMDALLGMPPVDLNPAEAAIPREDSPFTIVPERPRAEVITYTVEQGDTITDIADQFGLAMDTIAWSNDYRTVFALRPGNEVYILPVDGVYHQVLVPQTIQSIADEYNVDPYAIINSEYNNFFGMTPQMTVPSGTRVVVPGGTSSAVNWTYNPVVERTGGGGGGSSSNGYISFAPGQAGSCGSQPNPGGTGYFVVPLRGYTWVRGFTSYHTGVDLSASTGTPVYAASPGRVIYAGWNDWGYGRLVVVAHGPFTTLYGHMDSISAGCGQMVDTGTIIGTVGSTGNSSGPHLHFEIRYNDIPTDPLLYTAF
ncbi:MAG: M23 family metallopeptidase [Anaerolineae bacterium]|nr:M23 family metallopeptidase [Anaerolineae bacterium]